MLVYDKMMHDKYMQEEGKRVIESRKKRREMETMELSQKRMIDQQRAEIKGRETEIER